MSIFSLPSLCSKLTSTYRYIKCQPIIDFFLLVDFDLLGLTDNQNPYGVLPPLLGRSLGRKAGSYFADYVAQFLEHKRTARSVPPSPNHSQFHGGER